VTRICNFNNLKEHTFCNYHFVFMLITLLELMLNAATFENNFAFFLLFIGLIVSCLFRFIKSNYHISAVLKIYHEEIVCFFKFL
jgi:hypothetical protein